MPAITGRRLIDLLGRCIPLTTLGEKAGVMDITLPDGKRALATVRILKEPLGQLAVYATARRRARRLALGHGT